jgi:hypothetical protein
VLDVPEASISNLGLIYRAQTHEGVTTNWQKEGIDLESFAWRHHDDGVLVLERTLPNRIAFDLRILPPRDHVAVEQWLAKGTDTALIDLWVQDCVLLKRHLVSQHSPATR